MEQICRFHRVLLKLSGEALKGDRAFGYEPEALAAIAERFRELTSAGIELAVVVGAGNLWRGKMGENMDRVTADHMGMLATAMNALALKEACNAAGISALVQASVPMEPFAPRYDRDKAMKALEMGQVVIFAGGTGNPFFTTDTAAALRAAELQADAVFKGTTVDGIYSADPRKDASAHLIKDITYQEAIDKGLKVMDATAFQMCKDQKVPCIRVFNMDDLDNIIRVAKGEDIGTTAHL